MFCKQCGRLIRDEAEFCPFCGHAAKQAEKPVTSEIPKVSETTVGSASYEEKENVLQEQQLEQEREDFRIGVGGFLFMLGIMLLLAVMCGVFAGMYFSVSERLPALAAIALW